MKLPKRELKKGDYLSPAVLAKVNKVKESPDFEKLELYKLANYEYTDLTIVNRHGGLLVLHDSDASIYNHNRFLSGIRRMQYSLHKMKGVDQANLDSQELQQHKRNIIVQSSILSATMSAARKTVDLLPIRIREPLTV
jgi:hypothetical protein